MVEGPKAPSGGIAWVVGSIIGEGELFELPLEGEEAS